MDIFLPIQKFADLVNLWLNIDKNSYLGSAINFFVYDIIKIGLLLIIINYIMAITRYYFPLEKIKNILTKRRWFGLDYLLAALLGVITPFCSCSSIPLFIGFLIAGIPLGITFSFLISSPLVNEASLYLFPTIFGLKTTLIYNITGILISILGGLFIQKLNLEKYVKKEMLIFKSKKQIEETGEKLNFKELLKYWFEESMNITKQVYPYVILGVALGALIHGFIPKNLVEKYLISKDFWTISLAVLLGAPLYANSVSVIPVLEALIEKGIPIGTALAFMSSIVTISLPEIIILKKVMKWQLLAIFLFITIFGIILIGYFMNMLI